MARHTFGEPITEDDILEIQGKQYPMIPLGMRAMRRLLDMRSKLAADKDGDQQVGTRELDLMVDIVVGCVREERREELRSHIDESVSPVLLGNIVRAVMASFSDLDPTQPGSSSDGSPTTGSDSADGAPAQELTPAT